MKNIKLLPVVKWRDKRLVIRSLLIGLALFVLFWGLAERVKPTDGNTFEKLPSMTGIYYWNDAGRRHTKSWIDGININCRPMGYYALHLFPGSGRKDCGLKDELHGHEVTAVILSTPSLFGKSPVVVKLISEGQVIYNLSDKRVREIWISESLGGVFRVSLLMTFLIYVLQFIYLDRRNKLIHALLSRK